VTENPRTAFFDGLAAVWDGMDDLDRLVERLAAGLLALGVGRDESVLDVGCGTGNLAAALLRHLSPAGRVTGLDLSAVMLASARRKLADPRVTWIQGDLAQVALPAGAFDRAICFSVWPHLDDPALAARRLRGWLRPGGWLHVWHLISRAQVNAIHGSAAPVVQADLLAPAADTAALLRVGGFEVAETVDDAERYLVSARRPEAA
jgi:demethylmenaquinone methyltransferase/2-methoxy-6-polyprenyl-1,4-benzoquinol methylase